MKDYSKIVEEKNRSMSFEEYKELVSKSVPKQSKFKKFIKTIISLPGKALMAFFGIDKDSIMSSGKSGHGEYEEEKASQAHSSSSSFKEQYYFNSEKPFDPTETYKRRKEEEAIGLRIEDIIPTLTEEEYRRRMQEDAYLSSMPGYSKKDNERDER